MRLTPSEMLTLWLAIATAIVIVAAAIATARAARHEMLAKRNIRLFRRAMRRYR
jgi:hypothetical protein